MTAVLGLSAVACGSEPAKEEGKKTEETGKTEEGGKTEASDVANKDKPLVWFNRCLLYTSAGASGAVFAVIGALIYIVIANRGRIENFTTRQLIVMAGLSLYFGMTSTGVDNAAHFGGLISGFILAVLCYRRVYQRRL